jgi:hypothetical protein
VSNIDRGAVSQRALRHEFTVSLFVDTLQVELAGRRSTVGARSPRARQASCDPLDQGQFQASATATPIIAKFAGATKVRTFDAGYDLADGGW